jgi:hypothetical protein
MAITKAWQFRIAKEIRQRALNITQIKAKNIVRNAGTHSENNKTF